MLSHLVIRNFAVIDYTEIEFGNALTVLTGETGAGKSIIINALNLLLAGRANTEVIRTGEDNAVVEGVFELHDPTEIDAILEEHGIEPSEGQLIIRRVVSRSGRNKVFINGSVTKLTTLAKVTRGLVDVSGQHEHVSLLDTDRHLDILDAYAKLGPKRKKMDAAYQKVVDVRKQIDQLTTDVQARLSRIDYIKFQIDEIERAELEEGEKEKLTDDVERLKHASRIEEHTQRAIDLCYENDRSINVTISEVIPVVESLAQWSPAASGLVERLNEAKVVIEDVTHELRTIGSGIDDDPAQIDSMIERLETIKHLERKHGGDITHILKYAATLTKELHTLENAEAESHELEKALEKHLKAAKKLAAELRTKRKASAKKLCKAVETELSDLNMSGTKFSVDFRDVENEVSRTGSDIVEFLVSPNVGEAPKPIVKIASGGELSRIMLALKTVHTERDTVATYIFDEVDTGIGGETADKVGDKLAKTAANHQVLCITHLAQIASRATHHMVVAKTEVDGRTVSTISHLDEEARVDEIARMLGGARVSEKTRAAARDLLRI